MSITFFIKQINAMNKILLYISGICSLSILLWVLWLVGFGFDFADEGFYLNWISNPFQYSFSTTQFGYFYYPMFRILGERIVDIRQANVLITYGLSWALGLIFLRTIFDAKVIKIGPLLVVSAALATSSLAMLRLWLPTPSYNWLNYQALIITMIGLLIARMHSPKYKYLGWILIGVSGWMAFMAKPTTAAVLGLFVLLYVAISGARDKKPILLAVPTFLVLAFIFAEIVDHSVYGFYRRLAEGLDYARLVSPNYDVKKIIRFDSFSFDKNEWVYFLCGLVGTIVLLCLIEIKGIISKIVVSSFLLATLCLVLLVVFGKLKFVFIDSQWVHLSILSIPVACFIVGLFYMAKNASDSISLRSRLSIFFILAVLPYAFAFGTGNNYWFFYGMVAFFWILAGICFWRDDSEIITSKLVAFGGGVQVYSLAIIFLGVQGPYAQPNPVTQSNFEFKINGGDASIFLPPSFGMYISEAAMISERSGFTPGTGVIDLTGHSPGVVYALGGSSIGVPWFYGNYENSNNAELFTRNVLNNTQCEQIVTAWILIEPNGPVGISTKVLEIFGANEIKDYENVGSFTTAPYVGGFAQVQTQILLKPNRDYGKALLACRAAKESINFYK